MFTNAQDMCIRKNYLLKYSSFEKMYFHNISNRFVATVIYKSSKLTETLNIIKILNSYK